MSSSPFFRSTLLAFGASVRWGFSSILAIAAFGVSAASANPDIGRGRGESSRPAVDVESLDAWLDELADAEVRAQCEHERAARDSESAILRSPWVAARGSTLQRGEFATGPDDPLYVRVRAGAGMSVDEWMRASLLDEYAERRCGVYRAQTRLRGESASLDAVLVESWKVQAEHLRGAVSEGQRLLERSSVELERGQRTVTEHLRVLSDFDRLGQALATADEQVARYSAQRSPKPVDEMAIDELRVSVAALEQVEGRLRRNRALALSVEAGYDEIIGVPQRLPLYGQVNLTFRPGYLWQSAADERSAAARSRAAALHAQRASGALGRAIHQARSQLQSGKVAETRLTEVIRTLEKQRTLLLSVQNEDAQLVAERLWFELQLQHAKLVRLRASGVALERWLHSVGSEPASTGSGQKAAATHAPGHSAETSIASPAVD